MYIQVFQERPALAPALYSQLLVSLVSLGIVFELIGSSCSCNSEALGEYVFFGYPIVNEEKQ